MGYFASPTYMAKIPFLHLLLSFLFFLQPLKIVRGTLIRSLAICASEISKSAKVLTKPVPPTNVAVRGKRG